MQAMKDSGIEWIGEIPEEWEKYKIKYIVSLPVTDGPHATPQLIEEGIPFISAEAVKKNRINFDLKRGYISLEDHLLFCKKCKPQKEDIFIVKSGATTGEIAYVDTDEEFSVWSPLALVRSKKDYFVQRFIFYVILSDYFRKQIELKWNYGTQQNIGMNVIENLFLLCPPMYVQQRIADYLDQKCAEIDSIISAKQRQNELLKQQRQSVIYEAVTGKRAIINAECIMHNENRKMKDTGIEWIGGIPEDWGVSKLKYLAKKPMQYGANETGEDFNEELPRYIRITDISLNNELKDDYKLSLPYAKAQEYILKEGDILFARSGATAGKSFYYKREYGTACFAGYLIRFTTDPQKALSEFIYYYTLSNAYNEWASMIFIQATIQNISAEKYANLTIPLPSLKEQRIIADYLDQKCKGINNIINSNNSVIKKLKEYRQSIIYEAVTGKLTIEASS